MAANLDIEIVEIESVVPYERNSKQHPTEQIDKIAKSITLYGFNVPILLDDDNEIIAGHGRFEAAKRLGLEKIPAIRIGHLTKAQIKAFRIADNRVTESPWDIASLRDELNELTGLDVDLATLGFDHHEIDSILNDEPIESQNGSDFVPDKDGNILVRLSFHPGIWLGKRDEIMKIFDKMEKTYSATVKVDE